MGQQGLAGASGDSSGKQTEGRGLGNHMEEELPKRQIKYCAGGAHVSEKVGGQCRMSLAAALENNRNTHKCACILRLAENNRNTHECACILRLAENNRNTQECECMLRQVENNRNTQECERIFKLAENNRNTRVCVHSDW